MRNLILAVAILAGTSTFASTENNTIQTSAIHTVVNNEFKEITLDKLPTTITEALKKSFPSAKLNKAYVNEKGQYKLEVSVKKTSKTLYADKDGKWLDAKTIK